MSKHHHKRSPLAQNRIDYIVYGNPRKARRLLRKYAVVPPKRLPEVLQAIKRLIQDKGKGFIQDLIRIHPDSPAILRLAQDNQQQEHAFCGSCGSHSFNPEKGTCTKCQHKPTTADSITKLFTMPLADLQAHYKTLAAQSSANPSDIGLSHKTQQVWHILSNRTKATTAQTTHSQTITKKQLCILALTFAAGMMIGSAIQTG